MAILWIKINRGLKLVSKIDYISCCEFEGDDDLDILKGLESTVQKKINSKYFYDKKGSMLFEKITKLKDYYPTKTELEILVDQKKTIAKYLPENSVVIEFGSGSHKKIIKLLNILKNPKEYISIDISKDFLFQNAKDLSIKLPEIKIKAICADFNNSVQLKKNILTTNTKIGFFPGSTIGNYNPEDAKELLRKFSKILGKNNYLLIGVDLKKKKEVLEKAYNDSEGITAQFNKNILNGINKKYGTVFDLKNYKHLAFFNSKRNRIEMHLVSKKDHSIKLLNQNIFFEDGETIHTENSYKYSINQFVELISGAVYKLIKNFTDKKKYFAIFLLKVVNR